MRVAQWKSTVEVSEPLAHKPSVKQQAWVPTPSSVKYDGTAVIKASGAGYVQ
jgi:hypothetical protein